MPMLANRYQPVELLGRGGMATVYRARDEWLKREVAVKVIASHLTQDELIVRRFRREAQLGARLSHANIVRTFDAGTDPEHFIVMELVEGVDARLLVKRTGRLSVRHALRIAGPICDALHHSHGQGVIHGDVSTSNILIRERDGIPKLADFGLASDAATPPEERPGTVTGTPGYMAPELLEGAPQSPRSDLYSVAAVLHRLLTGTSRTVLAYELSTEPAATPVVHLPPLEDERPDLPRTLLEAVERALSEDPDERQVSVAEFRAEIIREAHVHLSLPVAA